MAGKVEYLKAPAPGQSLTFAARYADLIDDEYQGTVTPKIRLKNAANQVLKLPSKTVDLLVAVGAIQDTGAGGFAGTGTPFIVSRPAQGGAYQITSASGPAPTAPAPARATPTQTAQAVSQPAPKAPTGPSLGAMGVLYAACIAQARSAWGVEAWEDLSPEARASAAATLFIQAERAGIVAPHAVADTLAKFAEKPQALAEDEDDLPFS